MALERSQRTGHRSLRRVLDEHQRKEKLVPRPDGHEDPERRDRRPRERDVDAPEQVPGGRAIDAGRLRDLGRHVDEVGAHPEDGKGHVQADQRQHDRKPSVVDPHRPLQEVERDDDPCERERQPEHEQEEEHARARDAQEADGKPGHRRDDQGHRHDGEHDERARRQERGHVRHVERLDEVAPLRVRGPFEPAGHSSRRMQRGHEDADEGQDRERHQRQEEGPACPEFAACNLHRVLSRLSRWIGRMTTRTRTMSMTARADARPIRCWVNARM